jgi:RNA polymerase sigma-70 factor (ECF subfamily)
VAETEIGGEARAFRSTLWTLVLRAKEPTSPGRREALEELIGAYWKPVYFFLRRKGNDPDRTKDLVQGFFTALLEKNYLQYVDRGRGKFRTFLLTALDHYVADERDRDRAQKRGGGRSSVSLDFEKADTEYTREPAASDDPDRRFRRDWALKVMARALQTVRDEFASAGRLAEYDALRLHLSYAAEAPPTYEAVAATLGISVGDVRNRVHRTRARYKEAILAVIRSYTETDEEAKEELQDLMSAFA